jgi:hypothetical protein
MKQTAGIFTAKSEEFHLREYECLRREIEQLSQTSRALERNVIVAVGITWGWLYSRPSPVPPWTYLIPCLFSILGTIRAYGIEQTFGQLGGYIEKIEDAFRKADGPEGWEHFNKEGTFDSKGQALFWIILNASSLAIAVLRFCNILK